MAFKKDYVVSTEDVNSFGFVVLTSGIDYSAAQNNCPAFVDHQYWELPVGHWENIRVEGTKLKATLVIEGANDRERDVIRKIENGDLRGASIGSDPKTWSEEPLYLKSGQTKPTLIACELFEISITALPSNKNALCLKRDGEPVKLNSTNIGNILPDIKPKYNMKAIALKLGLLESATEGEIVEAINRVQLSQKNSEQVTKEVLDKAAEGLEPAQKEIFVTLCATNAKQAITYAESVKASAHPAEGDSAETTPPVPATLKKDVKVSELIKLGKKPGAVTADEKDCFDYLQKHDPVELKRIHQEEPDKYAKLARDYQKGVRYTGKTA